MTYASKSDLQGRYGKEEVVTLGNDPADAEIDRTVAALSDAAVAIDAVLATSYALPLGAGPWPQLTSIQCRLARAGLYDDSVPDRVLAEAKRAREDLEAIADGKAELLDGAGVAAARRPLVARAGREPVMTDENLAGLR